MTSIQKRLLAGALAAALAGLYAAPYLTVYAMRRDVRRHDAAALSRHIDFPALRAHLKTSLTAGLISKRALDSRNPFARFGALLAGAAVDQYLSVLVTPQGVACLMQGNSMARAFRQKIEDDLAASDASATAAPATGDALLPPVNRMGYAGLNTFDVTIRSADPDGPPTTLVLRRAGLLTWKLADIVVTDASAAAANGASR